MSLLILYVMVSTSKAAGSLHARGDGLQQCPRARSSASCGRTYAARVHGSVLCRAS